MKIKKIGAILAGAVMIGSAVAAAWNPAEDREFFVDPDTGQPNAVIVVGTNAAAGDVTGAGWLAAQIGSMAYYEEEIPQYFEDTWYSGNLAQNAPEGNVLLAGAKFYGTMPVNTGVLETLWWVDSGTNPKKINGNEPMEGVYILPFPNNGTALPLFQYGCDADGWNVMSGHKTPASYEQIHFLGYEFVPLRWYTDKVLCATTLKEINEKFYLNEITFNGWTLNMDISATFWGQWNRLDLLVIDPAGGLHEDVIRPGQDMVIKYNPTKERYYLEGVDTVPTGSVKVFDFDYNGCFLGKKNEFVLADIEASSGFDLIKNAYCLRPSGIGGPEFNLIVDKPSHSIQLQFIQMPGIWGTPYYVPSLSVPIVAFDPTEVETWWANENPERAYLTVDLVFKHSPYPSTVWYVKNMQVHQAFEDEPITVIHPVIIDPTELVVEDSYIVMNPAVKSMKNLILIGGPGLVTQGVGPDGETFAICNQVTKDLVDTGWSVVDWFTSPGEYEYLNDVYVGGKDVIIVAGADRIGTKLAVQKLLEDLRA